MAQIAYISSTKINRVSTDRHEELMDRLRTRTMPFFLIVLFSAAVSVVRIYLIPEFSLFIHFLLFLVQIGFLSAVWFLVNWLNGALDKWLPFERGPLKRIALQVLITMLIVGPVLALVAYLLLPEVPAFVSSQFIGIAVILFVVIIFLFNFGFYAFYFFRNWQRSVEEGARLQVQAAQLEREKFNLQYHQLRNQVNPHYLFNSLTSLDGLIHSDPVLASEFLGHMAKVYRYTLQHKESEVVSLQEELNFISHYIRLLQIRYGAGLKIGLQISRGALEKGIVMVTLQMLIDNAVKHNSIDPQGPLELKISDADGYLVLWNNRQPRRQMEHSNGQGLKQLKQLYGFLTEEPVVVEESPQAFVIKLPLLPI